LKGPFRVSNDSNSIILKPLADAILDIITNRIARQVLLWIDKTKAVQDLIVKDPFEDIDLRSLEKLFIDRFPSKIVLEDNDFSPNKKLKQLF
jgi:hypothetical protein